MFLAMLDQSRFAVRLPENHGNGNFFSPGGMRHAKSDGFSHAGMRQHDFIDFQGRNLFSTAHDEFFKAGGEMEIAFIIQPSLVAGAEPALGE